MPVIPESGLVVSLPDGASFRFAECAAYDRMKGCSLKEMDFGYWHEEHGCVVLLELKDYSRPTPLPSDLLDELVAKGRDGLLMTHAVWSGRGAGRELAEQLPDVFRAEARVRLCFVMKLGRQEVVSLRPLRDLLKYRVLVYAELLGLKASVQLLDHETARAKGLPVAEPS